MLPFPDRRAIASGDPLANRHVRALDGLRGVALLVVLLHHLNYTFPLNAMLAPGRGRHELEFIVKNGWAGVDVFFVLSGFLITTILMKSRGAVNFYGAFYMRRVLRLAPLYFAVLAIAFFAPWPDRVLPTHATAGTQMWWWLNASNLRTAFAPGMLSAVSLFWSLAVEEQFYLVWPTVVRRVRKRALVAVALGGVLAEMVARVLPPMLHVTGRYPEMIYRMTPLHCDGLLLGAATAVLLREGVLSVHALPWLRAVAGVSGVVALAMLRLGYRFYTTPVIALCTAAVVAWLVLRDGEGALSRVLRWGPLRLVGRYSYCMYVTQTLVLVWAGEHLLRVWHPAPGWPLLLYCYGGTVLLSTGLGAVSWAWIESPINGWKRFFPYCYESNGSGTGGERRGVDTRRRMRTRQAVRVLCPRCNTGRSVTSKGRQADFGHAALVGGFRWRLAFYPASTVWWRALVAVPRSTLVLRCRRTILFSLYGLYQIFNPLRLPAGSART